MDNEILAENRQPEREQRQQQEKEKTPRRLKLALEAQVRVMFKDVKVTGKEHLSEIPPDKKVVIVTSHKHDVDMVLVAYALADDFNIGLTHESIHNQFTKDPGTYIGLRIAGKKNFIPLDYTKTEGNARGIFNPKNLREAARIIEERHKTPIVAGYNPLKENNPHIKGGYSAVYLGQFLDAVFVPVSVELKTPEGAKGVGMQEHRIKSLLTRSEAEVVIGKPFSLEPVEGLDEMETIMEKRKLGEELNEQERARFSQLKETLQERTRQIHGILDQTLEEGSLFKLEEKVKAQDEQELQKVRDELK